MKKLVLLGDSIRLIGYGKKVAEILKDEFETWQPEDNCRFSKYLLRLLFDCKDKIVGADVVHFNCGLWDITRLYSDGEPFTSFKEYKDNVLRIVNTLKSYGVKTIIFSTTTPCRLENPYNDNTDIKEYNSAVVKLLIENGVTVNDLFTLIEKNISEYIRGDDLIHLTDAGIEVASKSISDAIRKTI